MGSTDRLVPCPHFLDVLPLYSHGDMETEPEHKYLKLPVDLHPSGHEVLVGI